eukprot:TRINITY_DN339_c0_g2_i1.p1 TRINITY_DN339_c0_g2~~TRINITY_DN339_c0_g2_i1.p1  ORF type:complete len:447 (-),score=64.09 TRINITY_DN339_c0_g2_i1:945-2285(-)
MLRLLQHTPNSIARRSISSLIAAKKQTPLSLQPPRPFLFTHAMRFRSSRPPTNELRAVVKIITSYVAPNNCIPWQSYPEGETSGSGAVISGRRILTNAHVVANHTVVSIQKHGCPVKYHAEVLHEAHECDLAVLTVEDDEFWKDVPELAVGEIPDLHSEITVVGYPIGGKEICVTSGIVSRIDMQHYSHSGAYLLSMQVDAAINPGNSGGPALQNGNIAGIVFQKSTTADSSGYVIPASLIQHVLADISKNGRVTGFPSIGAHCQGLEDPYMRNHYGVPQNKTGVLVRFIQPTSAAAGIVESGDVLTDIDGISISNDGMVPLRGHERINFIYHILLKHIGDPLVLGFVRKGKEMSATVNVSTIGSLVPVHAVFLTLLHFPSYFFLSSQQKQLALCVYFLVLFHFLLKWMKVYSCICIIFWVYNCMHMNHKYVFLPLYYLPAAKSFG